MLKTLYAALRHGVGLFEATAGTDLAVLGNNHVRGHGGDTSHDTVIHANILGSVGARSLAELVVADGEEKADDEGDRNKHADDRAGRTAAVVGVGSGGNVTHRGTGNDGAGLYSRPIGTLLLELGLHCAVEDGRESFRPDARSDVVGILLGKFHPEGDNNVVVFVGAVRDHLYIAERHDVGREPTSMDNDLGEGAAVAGGFLVSEDGGDGEGHSLPELGICLGLAENPGMDVAECDLKIEVYELLVGGGGVGGGRGGGGAVRVRNDGGSHLGGGGQGATGGGGTGGDEVFGDAARAGVGGISNKALGASAVTVGVADASGAIAHAHARGAVAGTVAVAPVGAAVGKDDLAGAAGLGLVGGGHGRLESLSARHRAAVEGGRSGEESGFGVFGDGVDGSTATCRLRAGDSSGGDSGGGDSGETTAGETTTSGEAATAVIVVVAASVVAASVVFLLGLGEGRRFVGFGSGGGSCDVVGGETKAVT